jgi:Ni/Co efflux regulator RcnB
MNAIFAALAGAVLIFGAAEAQSAAQEHGNPPAPPPRAGFPGNSGPQIGGPNRHSSPGIMPNHLGMNRNGEIESVGPNRPDGDNSHFGEQRGNFAAGRRFHTAPWTPPAGYQYRRWTTGEHLPPSYYGPDLRITRFGLYGLTTPPPDKVWVRSGPDALLVDRANGEIVRTQYGLFD